MTDTGFSVSRDKRMRIAAVYGHPDVTVNTIGHMWEVATNGLDARREVEATCPSDKADRGHGGPAHGRP
jgi:hypothetical protein